MRYTLKDYQADAAADILANIQEAQALYREGRLPTMALTATTGGGKTVIAAAVIEALFFGSDTFDFVADPGAVVLWFSDDPTLNAQSRHRLETAAPDLIGRMTDLNAGYTKPVLDPRTVYFINTQKFAKSSRMVRGFQPSGTEGQDTFDALDPRVRPDMVPQTIYDIIAATIDNPDLTLYFFLDEAHKGMGTTARAQAEQKTIVKRLIAGQEGVPPMPVVFGISATLERFTKAMSGIKGRLGLDAVEVDPARIQASGLLKDNILLNIPHPDEVGSFETVLLRSAVRQLRESEAAWAAYAAEQKAAHPGAEVERVVPLMVLQTPNSVTPADIAGYLRIIMDVWPDMPADAVAHVFGEKEAIQAAGLLIPHIDPERVEGTKHVRILLAKEAVTTGWDCPRAEVLMSFRTVNDLTKITQTLGRMVRTPLARRIPGNDDLNSVLCLLPNFDDDNAKAVVAALMAEEGLDPDPDPGPDPRPNPTPTPGNGTTSGGANPTPDPTTGTGPGQGGDREPAPSDTADPAPAPDGGTGTTISWDDEHPHGGSTGGGTGTGRVVLTQKVTATPIDNVPLWDLFESLPTETTPSRGLGPVPLLTALGQYLSEDGLRTDAGDEAHRYLHAALDYRAAQYREDVDKAVHDILEVKVRTILTNRATGKERIGKFTERADLAVVREAYQRAARAFTADVSRTYVNHLVGSDADEDDLREAYARVAGLAAVPDIVADLKEEASRLVGRWFQEHRTDIKALADDRQAAYKALMEQSTEPQRANLAKPVNWQENPVREDANGNKVSLPTRTDHLLTTENGTYPVNLNRVETAVVDREMGRRGAVAWYRNPSRVKDESLAIAYRDGNAWRTMRPDFLFFHEDAQGRVRASIVDPHGHHLSDALPKLRGLARYAEQYGDEFMRIEGLTELDGKIKALDMTNPKVREAVEDATSARALYESDLAVDY
ncbi:DEAD/DEAH box helicase family protein [Micrococcus lylae]|uniref:DEAD/DEAH box helicase family protein n=1 Tax=Micrococcus lylae TaxID=1273 RepID=UPI0021A8DDE1|nr:DEAD/DEAH box helicase family protein [Micrococcus lylae]MCT2008385.1 DEAD/DEAH box helicase family protein [Micrococcus lylae]